MTVTIYQGDCREVLKTLADGSVDCCVTSPPYFGLRDYGHGDQIGLEDSPAAFIQTMVEVFREVRRVMKDNGTLWVNMGDSYVGALSQHKGADSFGENSCVAHKTREGIPSTGRVERGKKFREAGLKMKDLVGIPWRLAFALQDDGWYLRQDIIWSKPNAMPESVKDRCTRSHEYIFMLTKQPKYYYNAEAIREEAIYKGLKGQDASGFKDPKRFNGKHGKADKQRGHSRRHDGFNDRWDKMSKAEQQAMGRNKRSVWEIAPANFREAHFATFPPALVEPCLLAGCPEGGTVLDPFFGAGTTGLVADRLQRNCIGVELNPEYVGIAQRRIAGEQGLFSSVEVVA